MKIERLSQDKIRIFLTFDDLSERGIQKEEMWQEIPKVYDLFTEMMDQAYSELGFDATGPLAVEVFALPAQGMVVIVTRGKYDHHFGGLSEDDMPDEIYEMEVTLDESDKIVYVFQDFEVLIEASHMLKDLVDGAGTLYHYMDRWFLYLEPEELQSDKLPAIIAVLAEFGESSSVTEAMLEEYGKKIMPQQAIEVICSHFQRQH
ncbi:MULTISPECIES: genetic competence negative regulator [Paenibacillus]|jgi:adapter protein MecA 1/2|uniref:Negative regulator of genetic competence n=2 Tax=Paenibacillus lactis TaxID=228574 RepID=G4HF66_9BACL|nr:MULTISPECIES: genetic competence negative regulator [Paenibacillus]EHB64383.1 Negative regulator of genetic competence [Paenibacillus lactis 154]MBP1892921.1 adapter protein MecA 1/2 [Paenibacillus lactis]MCM3495234.1 genetic competence negative regulator [Paenibacillus lactis]GIO91862.1 adapter protein MecA [Paenibacillus lactis]HAF97605.1 genetic competence negative regulator [Paenibacillus lactis]